jgi:hypothetical protein
MSRVFISFRAEDEPYGAVLIQAALACRIGAEHLFRSSVSIRPGDDFVAGLTAALHRCDVVLVVIGRRWLAADADGRSRLHQPGDWVYWEIATALGIGKRVIPVLLGGARMPSALELPPAIVALTQCQYRRVDHRQFDADIGLLADDLVALLLDLAHPRAPRLTDNGQQWFGLRRRR